MIPLAKMKVRLFAAPVALLGVAPIVFSLMLWGLPAYFADVPMLVPLAQSAANAASLTFLGIATVALAMGFYQS